MYSNSDVALVTVTYGERLHFCVEAVRSALACGVGHAFIVANGESNVSMESLKAHMTDWRGRVTVVSTPRNFGSAGGYRLGIEHALETWPLILLLDDDNSVEDHFLSTMISYKNDVDKGGRDCSLLGLRIQDQQQNGFAVGKRTYPKAGSFLYGDLRTMFQGKVRTIDLSRPLTVPYGPYGGLLVSRENVDRVGLPDASLILYEDDTAFTSKLSAVGPLILVPTARVEDRDGKWSEQAGRRLIGPARALLADSPDRLYYSTRNRTSFDLDRARASHWDMPIFALNISFYLIITVVIALRYSCWANWRIWARAVMDGLRGSRGVFERGKLDLFCLTADTVSTLLSGSEEEGY